MRSTGIISKLVASNYRQEDEEAVHHASHKIKADAIRRALATITPPFHVLDLGCGTGRYFHCVPAGGDILGVDASPEMLREAHEPAVRPQASFSLQQADILTVAFDAHSFHAVVCMGVLGNEILMELHWLERMATWLRPGGVFVFSIVGWQPEHERLRSWRQHLALSLRPFLPARVRRLIDARFDRRHLPVTFEQATARLFAAGFSIKEFQAWQSPTGRIDFIGWAERS
jgi:SAM-dependent methyltransferase